MSELVNYQFDDGISTITMDDGKVNVLSFKMFDALNQAFDQAEKDQGVVIFTGREGKLSAGFDLKVLEEGPDRWNELAKTGAELVVRLFEFKNPVITACNGHAFAMAAFLMNATTIRIGVDGDYKIGANEASIDRAVPNYAIELCKHRLSSNFLTRSLMTAEMYSPSHAVEAGYLDMTVSAQELKSVALEQANRLKELGAFGYQETLLRIRRPVIEAMRKSINEDY